MTTSLSSSSATFSVRDAHQIEEKVVDVDILVWKLSEKMRWYEVNLEEVAVARLNCIILVSSWRSGLWLSWMGWGRREVNFFWCWRCKGSGLEWLVVLILRVIVHEIVLGRIWWYWIWPRTFKACTSRAGLASKNWQKVIRSVSSLILERTRS